VSKITQLLFITLANIAKKMSDTHKKGYLAFDGKYVNWSLPVGKL